jgi:hypothetical protein
MAVFIYSPIPSLFVHVPKTGGSSIQAWLIENTDAKIIKGLKHVRLEILSTRVPQFDWSFCVVRNPWDWVVSWYFFKKDRAERRLQLLQTKQIPDYKIKNKHGLEYNLQVLEDHKKGFDYFVENLGGQTQSYKSEGVDTILKLENLKKDFQIIQEKFNCNNELPFINISKRDKNYRQYYNNKTKDIIYQKYKDDIKKFKYEF